MDDLNNIRIVDNVRDRERQRRRETTRLLLRTLGYLSSVIPALLIGWKLGWLPGQQQPQPQVQHVAVPAQPQPQPQIVERVIERPEPRIVERKPREVELPPDDPLPVVNVEPVEQEPEPPAPKGTIDKASGIVTLTLEKPVMRVIARPGSSTVGILCDVGVSRGIAPTPSYDGPYTIVAEKLLNRGKLAVFFPTNIANTKVGMEISVIHRINTISCELWPKVQLPSGAVQQFTIKRLTMVSNKLRRQLADADAASEALPTLQSQLAQAQAAYRAADQEMRLGGGSNPAEAAARQSAARIQATQAKLAGGKLIRSIARANELIAAKPQAQADLTALEAIAAYSNDIVSVETIAVRFYDTAQTYVGEVK